MPRKLNFVEKSSRPDIASPVHQCARFSADPREPHTDAVRIICRYLAGTKDRGIIMVDADFCGLWDKDTAIHDPSTAKSRSGFIIKYAGCPIIWALRLQTETALSTTEAEYIALSTALREAIPLMEMLKEIHKVRNLPVSTKPKVMCKVFEDNSGALEIARLPKMRPRTKHINVKYHHFREYVERKEIEIYAITTDKQQADLLTKNLPGPLFAQLREAIMGW